MSLDMLRFFVKEELPAISASISTFTLPTCLRVLNAMTGLEIQSSAPIRGSSEQILAELEAMKVRGTLHLVALPRGLAEIKRINDKALTSRKTDVESRLRIRHHYQ